MSKSSKQLGLVLIRGGVTGDGAAKKPRGDSAIGAVGLVVQQRARSLGVDCRAITILPGVYSTSTVDSAQRFVGQQLDPAAPLVVYGYSRGGDAAVDLARSLAKAQRKVDLLITVDAAYGPVSGMLVDRAIPANVEVNINYYQTQHSGVSSSSASSAASGSDSSGKRGRSGLNSGISNSIGSRGSANQALSGRTRVFNYEMRGAGMAHDSIDERTSQEILIHITDFLRSGERGAEWNPPTMCL